MESVIEYVLALAVKYPGVILVLSVLGTLDVIATIIIKATKTTKDDQKLEELKKHKVFGPLLKAIEKFSFVELKK